MGMSSKSGYTKKILEVLGQKPAIPTAELKTSYALTRSVKNLVEGGYAEIQNSDNQPFLRITQKGKAKLHSITLVNEEMPVPVSWDGFWRIILLDLPESRKSERESLRYLLKKAGFVCLKNSAWISPYPFEHLFTNIKKDLGLTTEMMIIVSENIDEETKKILFEAFGNKP